MKLRTSLQKANVEEMQFLSVDLIDEKQLTDFFQALKEVGDDKWFHPHSLTSQEAAKRICYVGLDLYIVLMAEESIVAYGMLRGWDEGYNVPSLGIAVHPSFKGKGIGRSMMLYLHEIAKNRGAHKVRLKVHAENATALALYRSVGYSFRPDVEDNLVGVIDL